MTKKVDRKSRRDPHTANRTRAPRVRAERENDAAAGQLCTHCGLCCDGTLFSYVPLSPQDRVQPPPSHAIVLDDGQIGMAQTCCFLRRGLCRIYESGRPANCALFRCKLLGRYAAGEITLDEALAEVHDTKQQIESIQTRLDAVTLPPARNLIERYTNWVRALGGCYARWLPEQENLLSDYTRLLAHLRRTFGQANRFDFSRYSR